VKTPSARRLEFDPWLIPAALLPLIPVVALLRPGIAATSDGLVHLLRTLQVAELVNAGVLYPQWAPDFYFGYGYPFFLFYAPGAHMLAAFFALLGLGVVRSLVAVQVASLVLGSTGAYLAARSLFRGLARPLIVSMAALAAAALYDFTPLRMRELFSQGNLSQLLALSILPWCLWALLAAARGAGNASGRDSASGRGDTSSRDSASRAGRGSPAPAAAAVAGSGALLAALLYAHHPTAFLAYPLLGLLALAVALLEGEEHRWRAVGRVAGAFVLGLLLSAPFVVPWVLESSYGSLGRMEAGPFNASLNLVPFDQLFAAVPVLDAASINPPQPHTLGLLHAILAALGVGAALILTAGTLSGTKWSRRAARTPGAGQQAASFDEAPAGRSAPFGRSAQDAQDAQSQLHSKFVGRPGTRPPETEPPPSSFFLLPSSFASRRAAVLLVIAALLAISLALMLPLAAPLWTRLPLARLIAFPWRLLGPAGLLAALMAATPLLLLPERGARAALVLILLLAPLGVAAYLFPPASLWQPDPPGGLTLADIGRYEASPGGSRGTASANEYLPRWVADPDPPRVMLADYEAGRTPQRLDLSSLPPGSKGETLRSSSLEAVYRLDLAQPGQVVIRSFYYPGWRAWIDGQETAISPGSPYGLITVAAPAGVHELRVAWGTTGPRTAGWVAFAAGIVGAGWLAAGGAGTGLTRRRGVARNTKTGLTRGREAAKGIETRLTRRREGAKGSPAAAWLAAAVIVVVAAAKIVWVEPHTGWFRLQSPEGAPRSMTHPLHIRFANGVELLGYDLPQDAVRQGGQLPVRLYWQAYGDLDQNLSSFVHLVSPAGAVTWANQTRDQAGAMPSKSWPTGFYVIDDFRLSVPGDTPPVTAEIVAGLLDEAGRRVPLAGGGDTVTIGQVAVREGFRRFASRPNSGDAHRLGEHITLAGYDAWAEAGNRIRLTLWWRTDARLDMDYSIFAQVVNEAEMIVGQADGPACEGACPMTGWTPGSTIEDTRVIPLPAGMPDGELHVVVGIYDLATGERLPVRDRRGADRPERAIRIRVQDGSGL